MFENYSNQLTVKNGADCLHHVASYGLTGSINLPRKRTRRTRRGTRAGRKLVRYISCIKLNTADRNKVSGRNKQTHTNINNLIVIKTDPVKPVSRNLNLYQSVIPVIVRPRRDLGKCELRNVDFRNLHVVKPSCSSQKVDEPLSVCYKNVQSLNNKAYL